MSETIREAVQVESGSGCCSSGCSTLLVVEPTSCCSPKIDDESLHARLADLLTRYNVNDYAASVRVFAVKP